MGNLIVIDAAMARITKDKKLKSKTEFHVHINQQSIFDGQRHKVFDYSEHKLLMMISKTFSLNHKNDLVDILEKYKQGKLAISWCEGIPVCSIIKSD